MSTEGAEREEVFPPTIADAVKASVEHTFAKILGEKPVSRPNSEPYCEGPCVAGIISFIGGVRWSLALILPRETALTIAQKFTGMEIAFDTADMGEVAAELVNVLAGEVVAQLERRQMKTQMSLPTVARGNPLELIPEKRAAVNWSDFLINQGRFWIRLACIVPGHAIQRMPGT